MRNNLGSIIQLSENIKLWYFVNHNSVNNVCEIMGTLKMHPKCILFINYYNITYVMCFYILKLNQKK